MGDVWGGFDSDARRIIRTALRDGWVAHRSNNNHVILRHPDGGTQAVARHMSKRTRARRNTIAGMRP